MKTLLLICALFISSTIGTFAADSTGINRPDSPTYKLTIGFTNVVKRTGMLYVGVVNEGTDINGESYRKTRIAVPATGEFLVSFDGLPAGKYVVKVFQDLNGNQKLDVSGQFPTEPFGFSNMPALVGPPSFSHCAFEVNSSKTITINLLGL